MEKLNEIISNLDKVLLYVMPGIIFLAIHNFICNKKTKGDTLFLLSSVVVGYIIANVLRIFIDNQKYLIISTLITSIASSLIFSFFYKCKLIENCLQFIGINKTLNSSMWDEISDNMDIFIKVYIPADRVIYHGLYKGREEKDENLYILLTDYDVRTYEGKIINDYTNERRRWTIINTKDINRVEITYDKMSPRSKKPRIKK